MPRIFDNIDLKLLPALSQTLQVTKRYTVIYEPGERNWSAYVPDLPGCIATAKTREELEQQIREAIGFHIEGIRLSGEPIPEPAIEAATVLTAV